MSSTHLPKLSFVIGGARAGKSLHAEQLAAAGARPVTYIATARVLDQDQEFAARVAHHRERRPAGWSLVEAPLDLAQALRQTDAHGHCILVDCLTLWLANLLCPADGEALDAAAYTACVDALESVLRGMHAEVIIVSNEIGLGVIPLGEATRRYVDELGRLNQRIAALASRVTLVVAGLPMTLKDVRPA
jgi:adenosylcobinamide kinase / adenosylcobinamide-phosphate guanylyltransferase